jgi:hypothetical protein
MKKKTKCRKLRDRRWHQLRISKRIGLTGVPAKEARAVLRVMLRLDGKKCAICGRKTKLVEDHCHRRRRHRGKLCSPCNVVLGLMKDSPERLRAAARYLEKYEEHVKDLGPGEMDWPGAVGFELEADHVLQMMAKYFPHAENVRLSKWVEKNWDKV